jgi:Holliday junction resolvase RusA-like endonuclease
VSAEVLAFVLDGNPPSGNRSARIGGARPYTPAEVRDYRERIGSVAFAEMRRQKFERPEYASVAITIYNTRLDADNAVADVLDGMNGIVYENDGRILDLEIYKRRDKAGPRVAVRVAASDHIGAGYGSRKKAK